MKPLRMIHTHLLLYKAEHSPYVARYVLVQCLFPIKSFLLALAKSKQNNLPATNYAASCFNAQVKRDRLILQCRIPWSRLKPPLRMAGSALGKR